MELNGYEIPMEEDENILEMGDSDGYTILQMHSMPLNCTFLNSKNGVEHDDKQL